MIIIKSNKHLRSFCFFAHLIYVKPPECGELFKNKLNLNEISSEEQHTHVHTHIPHHITE